MSGQCGLATLAFVWLAVGCTDRGRQPRVVVRDSAGVEIVVSHRPRWDTPVTWRVNARPTLEIGKVTGEPGYEFDQIAGVVRLDDGRIVVADGGSSEVRFFDPRGGLRAVVGGRGRGPGKFEIIASLGRAAADTVWVYDFALRRLSFYTGNADLVGVVSLGPEIPTLGAVGRLEDGSFVMAQLWASSRTAEERTLGLRRDPVVYAHFSAQGQFLDTIGLFPGREINLTEDGGRLVMGTPLFGRTSSHAIVGQDILVGDQETFEVGRYSVDGTLQRLFRIPNVDLTISPDDLAALKERDIAAAPQHQRAARRAYLEGVEHPDTRPAYQYVLVDEGGNVWASEYAGSRQAPARWTVLDPQGRWLGSVAMPERFRPYEVGESWILGVATDELDLERVQLYELIKGR